MGSLLLYTGRPIILSEFASKVHTLSMKYSGSLPLRTEANWICTLYGYSSGQLRASVHLNYNVICSIYIYDSEFISIGTRAPSLWVHAAKIQPAGCDFGWMLKSRVVKSWGLKNNKNNLEP